MAQTINISLPKVLSEQIRAEVENGGYVSVSEFIREAVRSLLRISTSFSPEAEKEILQVAKSSPKKDLIFDTQKISSPEMFKRIEKTS